MFSFHPPHDVTVTVPERFTPLAERLGLSDIALAGVATRALLVRMRESVGAYIGDVEETMKIVRLIRRKNADAIYQSDIRKAMSIAFPTNASTEYPLAMLERRGLLRTLPPENVPGKRPKSKRYEVNPILHRYGENDIQEVVLPFLMFEELGCIAWSADAK